MNPTFQTIDIIIFAAYLLLIVGLGIWISHRKKNKDKTAEDYFLAGKSLPWWTIGASLIAANISAEQFIGMSGSGFGAVSRWPPTNSWPLLRSSSWPNSSCLCL